MVRTESELFPKFTAEIEEIRNNGITEDLLNKIITKHLPNATYNKRLYKRYEAIVGGVPIFDRQPKYEEETDPINNKVNNDFFGEIVDFKVGYFAGSPATYSYSVGDESEDETGGEKAVKEASKALTDFTTRTNMYGVDMETTKNAAIYGYSGRLFYIDKEGNEQAMAVHGFETIPLSDTNISEPDFAIRYYSSTDINGAEYWNAIFYDNKYRYTYKGQLGAFKFVDKQPHLFDYCPLQGIANNSEYQGDAEKVLCLIDDYNKNISDNSNEIEAFVHAMLLVNLNVDDEMIERAQKTGSLIVPPVGTQANGDPVKWVTKNINDTFTEHHLERLENNIYRFSKTPNMNDDVFSSASGIALKFRLHGLETKCATFEANMMNAEQHMWKVLCSSWAKKGVKVDPLYCCVDFVRNFPLDTLSEAQTAQAQIAAGLPKRWVYSQMSSVDDVDLIMDMVQEEKEEIAELYPDLPIGGTQNDDKNDSKQPTKDKENKEDKDDKKDESGKE